MIKEFLASVLLDNFIVFFFGLVFRFAIKIGSKALFTFFKEFDKDIQDYKGILPIDHGNDTYLYNRTGKNIEFLDSKLSFFIPQCETKEDWVYFDSEVGEKSKSALIEHLFKILSLPDVKKDLDHNSLETNNTDKMAKEIGNLLEECRKKVSEGLDKDEGHKKIFGVKYVALNRLGKEENPWCRFTLYTTDTYTKMVMKELLDTVAGKNATKLFKNIENFHIFYPFVYELDVSINFLISDDTIVILKSFADKISTYALSPITPENYISDDINLKQVVKNTLAKSGVNSELEEITFSDVYYIKEEHKLAILSKVSSVRYDIQQDDLPIQLKVSTIRKFLKDRAQNTTDNCVYNLVIWLSRNCIKKALEENNVWKALLLEY